MSPLERGTIGVVEDDEVMGGTLTQRLRLEGYRSFWCRTGQEAFEGIKRERPDLVICDLRLPDMNGEDIYLQLPQSLGSTPFLFVTAFGQIEQAVRLVKAGAIDYVIKPYALPSLLDRVEKLLSLQPRGAGKLGNSPAMRQLEVLLIRVANLNSTLLFTGESGVGKEVAAHFVHESSTRAKEPFIAVNCAAIPGELIESQLFGHEKGAFTNAHQRHHGYLERAGSGVLFLDEVGELPLLMQAKLLRVIQERAYTRVGGETTYISNARIICATNSNLEIAVTEGRFRRDLYYRINVISVEISPIRDRPEDILPLAHRFKQEFSETFDRPVDGFTPAAERAMVEYTWPGNVRELRNRIERAVALSERPLIGIDALFPTDTSELSEATFRTLAEIRDRAERHHIRAVLTGARGRIDEVAKLLGVSRSTLFEKMRKFDIRSEL